MTKKERPDFLTGKTYKERVACGNLYVTINFLDDKPYEIFVDGSKEGTCRSNLEGLGRALTLCVRHAVPISEIVDQIGRIRCPACFTQKGKESDVNKKREMPWSCPDAIAKILSRL